MYMSRLLNRLYSSPPPPPPPPPPIPNLKSGGPLHFFHVPKAGSSFADALWQWGCNESVYRYASGSRAHPFVPECADSFTANGAPFPEPPGLKSSHLPLLDDEPYSRFLQGHVVGMIRHPVERIASGYAHRFHDCDKEEFHKFQCERIANGRRSVGRCPEMVPPEREEEIVVMYARCVQGCAAHMLTGRYCNGHVPKRRTNRSLPPRQQHYTPIEQTRQMALARLRGGVFGFVGDTDQWSRSICIFAGIYPPRFRHGYDYSRMLSNSRPSEQPTVAERAKAILLRTGVGLRDPDAELHAETLRWMDAVEPHLLSFSHYRLCRQAVAQAENRTLRKGVWAPL